MLRAGLIMILCIPAALTGVDWFGYYESEMDGMFLPGENICFGYNKFRLDMTADPTDHISIGGDLVVNFYNGKTSFNYIDYLPESMVPVLPLISTDGTMITDASGNPVTESMESFPYEIADTMYVDNIFLEFRHDAFDLTLGKQQISPGVGYAWNPTDIFNLKDIMDPTYEQVGVDAVRLEMPLGTSTTFSSIFQPGQSWDYTTQFYQIKTWLGRYDLSLLYAAKPLKEISFSAIMVDSSGIFSGTPGAKFPLPTTESITRELAGLTIEGEMLGLGVRTEIALNRLNNDNNEIRYELIAGFDYTFESSLYILTEYYYNEFGSEVTSTTLNDYANYLSGYQKSVNRNYFFSMAMYPLTDLITGSALVIANLDDNSVVVNPQIDYNIYQDVVLNVMGSFFIGENTDEFGYQNYGFRLRLRAYF